MKTRDTDFSDLEMAVVAYLQEELFTANTRAEAGWFAKLSPSKLVLDGAYVPMSVMRGEPMPEFTAEAMEAGAATIYVRIESGMTQNTTRFRRDWKITEQFPLTINATVDGNTVTFDGTGDAYMKAGIAYDGTGWALVFTGPTTAAQTAAQFATIIPGASASGSTVTLPTNHVVTARTVADWAVFKETGRMRQAFCVEVFAASPTIRDLVGKKLKVLMDVVETLTGPNGGSAEDFRYILTFVDDQKQKTKVYRRWDRWDAEFASGLDEIHSAVLFVGLVLNNVTLVGDFSPDGPIITT